MWPVLFWWPRGRGLPPLPIPSFFVLVLLGHTLGWVGAWFDLGDAGWTPESRLVLIGATILVGWLGSHVAYAGMVPRGAAPPDLASGASVAGGLFAGFGSGAAVAWVFGYPIESFFDGTAPWTCIGVAIGRLGCLAAGCDFGRPAPAGRPRIAYPNWACTVPRIPLAGSPAFLDHVERGWLPPGAARSLPVHPVPLYYAFSLALAGAVTACLPPVFETGSLPGVHRYFIAAFLFAAATWCIEPLRGDADRGLWRGASAAQWTSLSVAILCVLAWLGAALPPKADWIPATCAGTASVVAIDLAFVSAAARRTGTESRLWTWTVNRCTTGGLLGNRPGVVTALSVGLLALPLAISAVLGREGAAGSALFLGGATANTIQRIRFGGFVDYFRIPGTRWACNLGDITLWGGVILWVF